MGSRFNCLFESGLLTHPPNLTPEFVEETASNHILLGLDTLTQGNSGKRAFPWAWFLGGHEPPPVGPKENSSPCSLWPKHDGAPIFFA